MKPLQRSLALPLCATFLVAFSDRRESPAFSPEEGSSVTKAFELAYDVELDDMSLILDGQDVGGMLGALELNLQIDNKITVTDEYGALSDGRPSKLTRTYDELESMTNVSVNTDMGGEEQEIPSASALEGETVIFTWDAEAEAYDATFPSDGDEDLLEGLEEDMDLRVMLPDGEVAKGDSWKVEIKDLQFMAAPGGNLHMLPDNMDEAEGVDMEMFEDLFGQDFMDSLADLYDGECTCTYKGNREIDGRDMGEISFEVEVGSAADLSGMILQVMEGLSDQFGEEMPELDIEAADFNLDLEGTGTVLWDLAAGRMHSMEVSGDMIVAVDFAFSVDAEGESHSAEISVELSGTFQESVETEE